MTLLDVQKLEVVYHRSITAVQGISFAVQAAQIVALLGTNGAGKTTTLRAISGFLGLDDARVSEGAIVFKGEHIENELPHRNTARGIVLVPERDKVFPNLTVSETGNQSRVCIHGYITPSTKYVTVFSWRRTRHVVRENSASPVWAGPV